MGRRLFFHTQPTVDSIYFSSPNFFEPPNNSNQKSFPSLQSNSVISPPISWNIRFSKQFSFSLVVQKIGIALYCGMENLNIETFPLFSHRTLVRSITCWVWYFITIFLLELSINDTYHFDWQVTGVFPFDITLLYWQHLPNSGLSDFFSYVHVCLSKYSNNLLFCHPHHFKFVNSVSRILAIIPH